MNNIFDSHAHYNDPAFDADRDEVLNSLGENGVSNVINCATDYNSSLISLSYAEKYPFIYASCGLHPEDIKDDYEDELEKIYPLLIEKKCVAVGEIGLDYHYDEIPRKVQIDVFTRQLIKANEMNLPVIVHDREAHADTLELLKKYKPKGVLHCFSGSVETAREVLNLGMYLGFGGVVTFKNAVKSVETAKYVPLDRILLETDCPYMAPVPYRGKRNDSSLIKFAAEKIGEIRGIDAQTVIDEANKNTKRLFNIK
ncbi:MAG: TatD family hydrolase [Oscillospiraceae bacterium]|nr:TatD family hydrolase [Oscillospiraceae bacterium]MDD7354076.1 TatD family hydrolase [Oscillospiraceae bacterium]MDY3937066.1 TatD family hydrolase [Oscillospiraceae bacterium]